MDGVVITGTGAVSPLGTGVPALIKGLLGNEVAVRPAPWAGPGAPAAWWTAVPDFRPLEWMSEQVEAGTDLFAQFALAAAEQAVRQAGLATFDPRRTAVVHGTSMGGMRALAKGQYQLDMAGPDAIDRKTVIKIWPNMAAAQIAMRYGLHGPQITVCTACASCLGRGLGGAGGTPGPRSGSGSGDRNHGNAPSSWF
jgi:3-oxoacyl-[acyl-carrier-protein] synthase II